MISSTFLPICCGFTLFTSSFLSYKLADHEMSSPVNLTVYILFYFSQTSFHNHFTKFNVGLLILTAVASDIKYRNQTLENKNENRIQ